MTRNTRQINQVVLAPGEYSIRELIFGLDFIVVEEGPLADKTFPIWDNAGGDTITYSEQVPLTLTYVESRSWRTFWRWELSISVSDGRCTVPVTEQSPNDVPIVIVIEPPGKPPAIL